MTMTLHVASVFEEHNGNDFFLNFEKAATTKNKHMLARHDDEQEQAPPRE